MTFPQRNVPTTAGSRLGSVGAMQSNFMEEEDLGATIGLSTDDVGLMESVSTDDVGLMESVSTEDVGRMETVITEDVRCMETALASLGYGQEDNLAQQVAAAVTACISIPEVRHGRLSCEYIFLTTELKPSGTHHEEMGVLGEIMLDQQSSALHLPGNTFCQAFAENLKAIVSRATFGARTARLAGVIAIAANSKGDAAGRWIAELDSLVKAECGMTLKDCVKMHRAATTVVKMLCLPGGREAFPDGSLHCNTALTTVSTEAKIGVKNWVDIDPKEWRAGIGVMIIEDVLKVKYLMVNEVKVFPSEFARAFTMLHGFLLKDENSADFRDDAHAFCQVKELTVWPLVDSLTQFGLGWNYTNCGARCAPEQGVVSFRKEKNLRYSINGELQKRDWHKQLTIAAVFTGILTTGIYMIGWLDAVAGSVLLSGLAITFLSSITDSAGWPYLMFSGYVHVGSGVNEDAPPSDVVVACYRNNICPYTTNTCWYDGPPAGPGGLPCGGLDLRRLQKEYFRGLLAKPGVGIFSVTEDGGGSWATPPCGQERPGQLTLSVH